MFDSHETRFSAPSQSIPERASLGSRLDVHGALAAFHVYVQTGQRLFASGETDQMVRQMVESASHALMQILDRPREQAVAS